MFAAGVLPGCERVLRKRNPPRPLRATPSEEGNHLPPLLGGVPRQRRGGSPPARGWHEQTPGCGPGRLGINPRRGVAADHFHAVLIHGRDIEIDNRLLAFEPNLLDRRPGGQAVAGPDLTGKTHAVLGQTPSPT